MALKFIKLLEVDGKPVWIATSWILAIRTPVPGEAEEGTGALVVISGYNQAVRESPETILTIIRVIGE